MIYAGTPMPAASALMQMLSYAGQFANSA